MLNEPVVICGTVGEFEVAVPAGVPAIMTCGGLFDFMAGDKRRAPRWMQRAGLEWLFRLLSVVPGRQISPGVIAIGSTGQHPVGRGSRAVDDLDGDPLEAP